MSDSIANKMEILKYVGDSSQIFGIKDYYINGGKAEGVRAFDVRNGSGLDFTVLASRSLDISNLSFKGVNFSYISKTGVVAPQYFNENGLEFLRSFYAGFLTTCGLTYCGSPCTDNGQELGLHGRISNTPAEEVCAETEWVDGCAQMRIKGKMREAIVFKENIVMHREILCKYSENKIYINDTVENCGFREEPLMILYHFNLGYPLLTDKSYLAAPSESVIPRDEVAAKGVDNYDRFQVPTSGYDEQAFYHKLKADEQGKTFAALINPALQLGVVIRFNIDQLNNMTQWKQMGEGDYVLGIEPCNCHVEGRDKERKRGTLQTIKPGETRQFNIEIEILEDRDSIEQILDGV